MATRTVLVVEDNGSIRDVLVRDLTKHGYFVLVAEDGERGWELAPNADFILLDLGLPRLRGEDILRRLREETKNFVPVIIMTATDFSPEKEAELQKYGIVDFVSKPFKFEDILRHIKKANGIKDNMDYISGATERFKEFIQRQEVATPKMEELNPPEKLDS